MCTTMYIHMYMYIGISKYLQVHSVPMSVRVSKYLIVPVIEFSNYYSILRIFVSSVDRQ